MLLKFNIKNTKREKRFIDVNKHSIEIYDHIDYYLLKLTTNENHNLNIGDRISLVRSIINVDNYNELVVELNKNSEKIVNLLKSETIFEKDIKGDEYEILYSKGHYWLKDGKIDKISNVELDSVFDKYQSFNDKIYVNYDYYSDTEFSISLPKYRELIVDETIISNNKLIIKTKEELPIILNSGDNFTVTKEISSYVINSTLDSNSEYYKAEFLPENQYLGYNLVDFNGVVYQWTKHSEEIICEYINSNYFSVDMSEFIEENDYLKIKDTRFITENGKLKSDVSFYEMTESISLNLPITEKIKYGLNTEEIIFDHFNDKKNEVLPDIIDYEKRCFSPIFNNKLISKINFNLFLRDRTGNEDWSTDDSKGWNQYRLKDDGTFVENKTSDNGDLLTVLGFTDEDVYYQKKKISKSFIRLSFYNNKNPLDQMLLFYSSIFLDTNDLYKQYIDNIYKKLGDNTISLINEAKISLNFNVSDRFNRDKSSEGFYLYLFPDGLYEYDENGEIVYKERTIYMKVEFNHAGYGKTVPLIYSNDHFSSYFKTSFIDDMGSILPLYDKMYIPVTIKYDENVKDFVYEFKDGAKESNNKLTINLYEPKINPLE